MDEDRPLVITNAEFVGYEEEDIDKEKCEKASEFCSLTDRVEPSRSVKEV